MNKLIITVGLPRSGKSTWSKEFYKKTGAPIVEGDAIRLALHGVPYLPETEDLVHAFGLYMIKALFHAGHTTVIMDDVHIFKKDRDYLNKGAWQIYYKVFNTSKEECLSRAINSGKPYLIDVIKEMDSLFEPLTLIENEKVLLNDEAIID